MRVISILMLVCAALTVSACNTVSGFGQDLQEAGEAITSKAGKDGDHR